MTGLSRFSDLGGQSLVAETSYTYDLNQRLIQLAHKKGANNLASYDYTFDAANKLTKIVSSIDGTVDYAYDATNQLTGADHSSQTDEAYQYDANGNRTTAGYQTGTNNQLRADGQFTYEYDGEGNRTKRTEIATGKVTEYVWDYHNRLTGVLFKNSAGVVEKNVEYVYDTNNLRIGKKIDGAVTERFVIDRNQIALVFDGSGVQKSQYLYGTQIDQVLAEESGAQVHWFLTDHQGTVKDVVDNAGAFINHVTYDSFGRIVGQTSPIELRFAYTGREWDGETGQYYYRARYYDAVVGRFIGEDPISFSAGDPNINRYVGNNPVNFVDPEGNRGMPIRTRPAPKYPGTGSPTQPINPLPRNIPGYPGYPTNYPANNNNWNPHRPTCVTAPGTTCNPIPEPVNPNICPVRYELEVPWRERKNWPNRCQLESQNTQPLQEREICVYKCRDLSAGQYVHAFRPLGKTCPQWIDWLPDDRWIP
jgi:RHS repeat-associated protein